MFRNILVAVDGSPASNRGLAMALALAKDQNATLHVVHVVDQALIALGMGGASYVPAEYVDTLMAALRDQGAKLLRKAEAAAAKQGQKVTTAVIESLGATVAYAILRQARKVHADIIVLGTHGRRGLRRVVLGSDAEAVLRESRVPVLIVRADVRVKRPAASRTRAPRRAARTTLDVIRTTPTP